MENVWKYAHNGRARLCRWGEYVRSFRQFVIVWRGLNSWITGTYTVDSWWCSYQYRERKWVGHKSFAHARMLKTIMETLYDLQFFLFIYILFSVPWEFVFIMILYRLSFNIVNIGFSMKCADLFPNFQILVKCEPKITGIAWYVLAITYTLSNCNCDSTRNLILHKIMIYVSHGHKVILSQTIHV